MKCPACLAETNERPLEQYFDPIGKTDYLIHPCGRCGTTFSVPRQSPGADWYIRFRNQGKPSAADWRYLSFLEEKTISGKVLDIGCGEGQFLLMAKTRGLAGSGFDFNPENIRKAAAAGLTDVRAADFGALKEKPGSLYDAATLFDVLEHAPEPGELLRDISGWLKPGGFLAISVPNGGRPRLGQKREGFDYPPFHFTRWTAAGMEKALAAAGFEVVCFRFSPLPLRFFSGLLYWKMLERIFPLLKKTLLGRGAQAQKTWTDLLQNSAAENGGRVPAVLASPCTRQKIIDAGFLAFSLLFIPIEAPLILGLRTFFPGKGRTLYCLAKKAGPRARPA